MDPVLYLQYTCFYIVINVVFAVYFIYLKRNNRIQERKKFAAAAVYAYIMAYVVLEAQQVVIEIEVSGSVYRFLGTFFMVSFFPVMGRWARLFYMTAYIVIYQGILAYAQFTRGKVYSFAEINLLIYIICLLAVNIYQNSVIDNFELRHKLEILSMKDELTGLENRRSMNQSFENYWKMVSRSGTMIGMMMIDIDHFKLFNDEYGHQAGDKCLMRVAVAIASCFDRSTDMVARYGGEEFVVVLPHTSQKEVRMMAEKVRASVEALDIEHRGNRPFEKVTCSIGMAVKRPERGDSHEALLNSADIALYHAKTNGRNRTQMADS